MGGRQGAKSPVQIRLKELGFTKIRERKHQIWKSPYGRRISVSVSPSDWRTIRNELSRIERLKREEESGVRKQ